MKKLLPLACLVAFGALASCTPDVDYQIPAPSGTIVAEFDPANNIIPTPNDLIPHVDGHLAIPDQATDSDTQKELNAEYLNTLDNFPPESSASLSFSAEVNPATINAMTIVAFDITSVPAPVAIAPIYANKTVTISSPAGGWQRAHHYAVVVVGGANGVKGVNGETVVGSTTWALVSGSVPLVTCTDQMALTGCVPAVDVIPGAGDDLATQYANQTATAVQLEQIRVQYNALLNAAAAGLAISRDDIPLAFTFTIADAAEATFDPANNIVPFPNDVVRQGAGGTISLPNPHTGLPPTAAECNTTDTSVLIVCGLNTLDGFSTQAAPVSENSTTAGALSGGLIDAASLSAASVGLVRLASTGPQSTQPDFTPCLNCLSSVDPTTNMLPPNTPQQLQWKLNAPLDEKTTYFGYLTTALKDTTGKAVIPSPTFALLRLQKPLLDANNKTTVSLITDAQAAQLEPLRLAFAPILAGLETAGLPRLSMVLGFPFTTQSEGTVLDQLYAAPTTAGLSGLVDYPVGSPSGVNDQTTALNMATDAAGIPRTAIAKWFGGQYLTIVAVTNPAGTFNPGLAGAKPQLVSFLMSLPSGTAPANGWPVTIFGHGITGNKSNFLAIANSLAQAGQVVIAPDTLFHGDRTSCTGSKSATGADTDDASCASATTMKCDEGSYGSTTAFGQGLCVLRDDAMRPACVIKATDPFGDFACQAAGNGRCAADGKCQGPGAGLLGGSAPAISGWNEISLSNFFATRDNFRQQVIDLAQLVRIIKSQDGLSRLGSQLAQFTTGNVPVPLDPTKINYVGQSLGGIQGTLFNAVSPDTTNAVLNVPGGNIASIILTAPSFAKEKAALLQTLAGSGLTPGHADFDQFIGFATWILDPADPANVGYRLSHGVDIGKGVLAPSANSHAFIQFIEGDETVPNVSNFALVTAADRPFVNTPPSFGCQPPLFCYEFTEAGDGFDATSAPTNARHTFLLKPPSATAAGLALTQKAQGQAATFIATGKFQ